jgi:hypothetical protein
MFWGFYNVFRFELNFLQKNLKLVVGFVFLLPIDDLKIYLQKQNIFSRKTNKLEGF